MIDKNDKRNLPTRALPRCTFGCYWPTIYIDLTSSPVRLECISWTSYICPITSLDGLVNIRLLKIKRSTSIPLRYHRTLSRVDTVFPLSVWATLLTIINMQISRILNTFSWQPLQHSSFLSEHLAGALNLHVAVQHLSFAQSSADPQSHSSFPSFTPFPQIPEVIVLRVSGATF